MKISVIFLVLIVSCGLQKRNINPDTDVIELVKLPCGSFEVKNDRRSIGYIVKPLIVDPEDKKAKISEFENALKGEYRRYYIDYFRAYNFGKNIASDTMLLVVMISEKQINSIGNWQCDQQEVDIYKKNRSTHLSGSHPQFLYYNCSRRRFKISGDPD